MFHELTLELVRTEVDWITERWLIPDDTDAAETQEQLRKIFPV